jgi:nicotinate phosphoribosyltransferase
MTPIVTSLLSNDLYKFTMWQPMLHLMPANQAEYRFVCRNQPAFPLAELKAELEAELHALCQLRFSEDELSYLGSLRYIKPDFVDYLRIFQYQSRYLRVDTRGDELLASAVGPQIHTTGFEMPVLYIINELYCRRLDQDASLKEARSRLAAKVDLLKNADLPNHRHPFEFFDFGLRRRFSSAWHEEVVSTLHREVPNYFRGTSNVYLAKKLGITPIGTMAHEYLQTWQAAGVPLRKFQHAALESWVQEYRGDLGTALTDVVGMDAFVKDFDLYFAKLFDGLRHDSGDPYVWARKAIGAYTRMRIDPHTKRLVFSDALTFPKAIDLYRSFGDQTQTGFGIGTDLTNDTGAPPLQIVMKLVRCNGQPVAKIPDSAGKTLCDDEAYLTYLKHVFDR